MKNFMAFAICFGLFIWYLHTSMIETKLEEQAELNLVLINNARIEITDSSNTWPIGDAEICSFSEICAASLVQSVKHAKFKGDFATRSYYDSWSFSSKAVGAVKAYTHLDTRLQTFLLENIAYEVAGHKEYANLMSTLEASLKDKFLKQLKNAIIEHGPSEFKNNLSNIANAIERITRVKSLTLDDLIVMRGLCRITDESVSEVSLSHECEQVLNLIACRIRRTYTYVPYRTVEHKIINNKNILASLKALTLDTKNLVIHCKSTLKGSIDKSSEHVSLLLADEYANIAFENDQDALLGNQSAIALICADLNAYSPSCNSVLNITDRLKLGNLHSALKGIDGILNDLRVSDAEKIFMAAINRVIEKKVKYNLTTLACDYINIVMTDYYEHLSGAGVHAALQDIVEDEIVNNVVIAWPELHKNTKKMYRKLANYDIDVSHASLFSSSFNESLLDRLETQAHDLAIEYAKGYVANISDSSISAYVTIDALFSIAENKIVQSEKDGMISQNKFTTCNKLKILKSLDEDVVKARFVEVYVTEIKKALIDKIIRLYESLGTNAVNELFSVPMSRVYSYREIIVKSHDMSVQMAHLLYENADKHEAVLSVNTGVSHCKVTRVAVLLDAVAKAKKLALLCAEDENTIQAVTKAPLYMRLKKLIKKRLLNGFDTD